jgi:hypothetical protein
MTITTDELPNQTPKPEIPESLLIKAGSSLAALGSYIDFEPSRSSESLEPASFE